MIQLHAPDAMGKASHDAAQFASALGFHLHGAQSATLTREARADNLRKAMKQWAPLCRAMAELGMTAPNTAGQAEADDQAHLDWIEGRKG